jgi:hypothetical protein
MTASSGRQDKQSRIGVSHYWLQVLYIMPPQLGVSIMTISNPIYILNLRTPIDTLCVPPSPSPPWSLPVPSLADYRPGRTSECHSATCHGA